MTHLVGVLYNANQTLSAEKPTRFEIVGVLYNVIVLAHFHL